MHKVLAFIGTWCLASSAYAAYDFSAADALFLQREKGASLIQQAAKAYSDAMASGQLDANEKVYAVEQIATVHLYHSFIIPTSDSSGRVAAANRCLAAVDAIRPKTSAEKTAAYYYWRAACMLSRANAQGVTASLSDSQEVLNTINAGIALDASYEGGGFDRLSGVLYSKLPGFNPFGPSGDMPRALRHFRKSLDAPAYKHPLNPAWRDADMETGAYFYSTHFYYAEALVSNRDRDGAIGLLEQAIADIDAGVVAPGRQAETNFAKARMTDLLGRIQ